MEEENSFVGSSSVNDGDLLLEALNEISDESESTGKDGFGQDLGQDNNYNNNVKVNDSPSKINLGDLGGKITSNNSPTKKETFYKLDSSSSESEHCEKQVFSFGTNNTQMPVKQEVQAPVVNKIDIDRFTGVNIKEREVSQYKLDRRIREEKIKEMSLSTYRKLKEKDEVRKIGIYAVIYSPHTEKKVIRDPVTGKQKEVTYYRCKLCDPQRFEVNEITLLINGINEDSSSEQSIKPYPGTLVFIIKPQFIENYVKISSQTDNNIANKKDSFTLACVERNFIRIGVLVYFGTCAYMERINNTLKNTNEKNVVKIQKHYNRRCSLPVNPLVCNFCTYHQRLEIQKGIMSRTFTSGHASEYQIMERMFEVDGIKKNITGANNNDMPKMSKSPVSRPHLHKTTGNDKAKEREYLLKCARSGSDAAQRLLGLDSGSVQIRTSNGIKIVEGGKPMSRRKKTRQILDKLRYDL